MKKGFLLIDGKKNTLFIDNKEFSDLMEVLSIRKRFISDIHQHKTIKALHEEISDYLKMRGYYNE